MIKPIDSAEAVAECREPLLRSGQRFRLLETDNARSNADQVRYLRWCLAALNEEIEAITRSVTHALRSPLWAVDGFTRMLLEELGEDGHDESRRDVFNILSGSEKMTALINELANLSKVTRHQMKPTPVDLSALASAIMYQLQEHDRQRDAEFLVAEGLSAEADSYLIGLALANLLGNAWKFTWERTPAIIEFGADHDYRGPNAGPNQTVYFVRDNGLGFDESYASRLFSPYQHLHAGERLKGPGMGLALVRRIVHQHNGRVWAKGRKNEGCSFFFSLGRPMVGQVSQPPG
jgi:light-regulated signal transduction histidine kinase (bacteriophytochrome)